jgi:hypothetical protein
VVRLVRRPDLAVPRLAPVRWLTVGTLRLAALSAAIVLIGMAPWRITPYAAGWIALYGFLLLAAAAVAALVSELRALTARLPSAEAVLRGLRHIGLVGLGATFFLAWTLVYLALWWSHPGDAFRGLSGSPRFADFFYYAVSTAFISPPGDIVAHSRGVRSATMIEMLTGFALLAAYLSSFLDWGRRDDRDA